MNKPRFFRKEIRRDLFHVFDREHSATIPVYDGAPYGNDKPLLMDDDTSAEWVERKTREAAEMREAWIENLIGDGITDPAEQEAEIARLQNDGEHPFDCKCVLHR